MGAALSCTSFSLVLILISVLGPNDGRKGPPSPRPLLVGHVLAAGARGGRAAPHVSVVQGEQPILATRSLLCSVEAVLNLPPRRFRRFLVQPGGCDAAVCHVPPRFLEFLAQGVGCDAAPAPSAVDAAATAVATSHALHLKGPRVVENRYNAQTYTNLRGPPKQPVPIRHTAVQITGPSVTGAPRKYVCCQIRCFQHVLQISAKRPGPTRTRRRRKWA